jgi:hypothetical protein
MTGVHSFYWLRLTGFAGMVGALFWIAGDVLIIGARSDIADFPLLLDTYADRIDTEKAAMMLPIPEGQLAAGALVADIGIVFYLIGCWHIFRGLLPAGPRLAWTMLVILVAGNAWSPLGHAGFYYLGMVYKTILVTPPEAHAALLHLAAQFEFVLQTAYYLAIVTLGLASLALAIIVGFGRTAWPQWFALLINPLSVVGLGTAVGLLSPEPIRTWLGGAAFNLGFFIVFLVSTILLWNGGRHFDPMRSQADKA